MEGCTRWLLILGSRREKDQHRGSLQCRLLKQPLPKNAAGAFRRALRRPAGTTLRGDVVFTPQLLSFGFRGHIRAAAIEATRTSATIPKAIPSYTCSAERIRVAS